MKITVKLKEDLPLDAVFLGLAMASSKLEHDPDLLDKESTISLHAPSRQYLGTIYIQAVK